MSRCVPQLKFYNSSRFLTSYLTLRNRKLHKKNSRNNDIMKKCNSSLILFLDTEMCEPHKNWEKARKMWVKRRQCHGHVP